MQLHDLIPAEYHTLLEALVGTVEELIAVLDELAFTKTEELSASALAWNGDPSDSIQKKDRAAKYSPVVARLSNEVTRLEGQRDALTEKKWLIVRLIDARISTRAREAV